MVKDGAFINKRDNVSIFKEILNIAEHLNRFIEFKSYGATTNNQNMLSNLNQPSILHCVEVEVQNLVYLKSGSLNFTLSQQCDPITGFNTEKIAEASFI